MDKVKQVGAGMSGVVGVVIGSIPSASDLLVYASLVSVISSIIYTLMRIWDLKKERRKD